MYTAIGMAIFTVIAATVSWSYGSTESMVFYIGVTSYLAVLIVVEWIFNRTNTQK